VKLSLKRLWRENPGAVATEYAFIIAFIAIVAAMGMTLLGQNLSTFYRDIGTAIADKACSLPDTASESGDENSNKCKDK